MQAGVGQESDNWLRWPAAGLLAAYALLSLYVLWRSAVLSVLSDEFDWVISFYRLQADHRWAAYLLAPHNINRLVWTRLLLALDMGVLGGTNAPLIISGALALAVAAATLSLQAARAAPDPLKLPAAALSAMLTLNAGNVLDASTPIYVTYTHGLAFAVIALVLSEGAPRSPFGWRGLGAIGCSAGSAFGSGVGLALWPVMAWGALRRRDWPWLAAVVLVGGLFLGLYFAGQQPGTRAAAAPALRDPRAAAILALSYLTLPWTRLALHAAWIGGALIGAGALALALGKGGAKAPPAQRIACGFILFTLTTAAMAGLGRSGDGDPYNAPLRYGPLVAPLQTGLLMLAAPYAAGLWRRRRRLVEGAVIALLAGLFVQDAALAVKVVRANDLIRESVADFHAGARTPGAASLVYPELDYAEAVSARLQRDGLYQHELHLRPRSGAAAKAM
jgi:hypothetical protein